MQNNQIMVTGTVEAVLSAREQLLVSYIVSYSGVCCSVSQLVVLLVQGCLPVVLMFDAYESEERTMSSCEFAL